MLKKICLALLIAGGLNCGLIGLFGFDCLAWLTGGSASGAGRLVFAAIGLAAAVSLPLLLGEDEDEPEAPPEAPAGDPPQPPVG